MQITGTGPKVNTLGLDGSVDDAGQSQNDAPVEDYFENAFGNPATGTGQSPEVGNPNPIDDYTFGDIQSGTAVMDEGADTSTWLASFPPSLEEIIAGNENAVGYLDLVMQRYEAARSDLISLRDTYRQALASGTLSISEAESLNSRMGLITQALARCDSEMQKVTAQAGRQETVYLDEIKNMKDLDNNGWIGRPRANGSYYVTHNPDGTTTFFDPRTRRAIPNPLMDPEYEPRLTENGALERIESDAALPDGGTVDLHLRLTEDAFSNFSDDNIYEAPIDIGIPEYIWVERKTSDDGDEAFEVKYNDETNEEKMVIYDRWNDERGLHQEIPTDLSRYMQIQVTGVKIRSVDSGEKDANGNVLYDHVVEYYNGEYLISRMQIEGFEGTGPGSTAIEGGGNYVAASSVGFSLHGSRRATPVKIDALEFQSTAHHRFNNVARALDISAPNDAHGAEMFRNQLSFFDADGGARDEYVDESGMNPNDIRDDVERRMEMDLEAVGLADSALGDAIGNIAQEGRTGIFVRGVRGDITGTNYNDIIKTDGVNELSDYAEEHLPDDRREIKKDDAFYSNRVTGGTGNNIVIAGRGDNYIYDASFAWIEGGGNDENFITTPDIRPQSAGSIAENTSANPSTFVHVDGGRAHIYNPDEAWDTTGRGDAEDEAVNAVEEILNRLSEDGDSDENDTIEEVQEILDPYGLRAENFITPIHEEYDDGVLGTDIDLIDGDDSTDVLKDAIIEAIENGARDGYRNDYYETVSGSSSFTNPDEDIRGTPGNERMEADEMMAAATDPMAKWEEELLRVPEVDENTPQISWDEVMAATGDLGNEMNSFFDEMFGGINDLFGGSDSADSEETI